MEFVLDMFIFARYRRAPCPALRELVPGGPFWRRSGVGFMNQPAHEAQAIAATEPDPDPITVPAGAPALAAGARIKAREHQTGAKTAQPHPVTGPFSRWA